MGLFDEIGKQLMGNVLGASADGTGGSGQTNWVQLGLAALEKFGGIDGLLKKFQENGFGELFASWVGTGKNLPVSADQIMAALGKKNVADGAEQAGTDAETAAGGLAQVLPGLVDKLTPDGQSVGGSDLQKGISDLLGGKLGDLSKLFG